MKVVVKVDSTDLFPHLYEGSVIQDVRKEGKNYVGVFSSFMGSYEVEIPKKRCKKINTKNSTDSVSRMFDFFKCKKTKKGV